MIMNHSNFCYSNTTVIINTAKLHLWRSTLLKAHRTWWNKTEIKQNCRRSGLRFSLPSTVLFYFS